MEKISKDDFLAGRIYQRIVTVARQTENEKIVVNFGVGEEYNLIKIIQILNMYLNKKAVFVVEPLDYGIELIIHMNRKDI